MPRKELCTKCLYFVPVKSPTYLGKFVCDSCKHQLTLRGKH